MISAPLSSPTLPMTGHWIGGRSVSPASRRTGVVTNPATGEEVRHLVYSGAADVDQAVRSAHDAFTTWRRASLAARSQVLFRFRELLLARRDELAALITEEHGKVRADALGEVSRGIEVVEFACGIPHLLKGSHSTSVTTNVDMYSTRRPLGVVAVITPFNFPAMVPLWFLPIAIACGNSVVLKPSERDPSAANLLAVLWSEAGLPAGVCNVVHGDAEAVNALLEHPAVRAVSFAGSTPVARHVFETASRAGKRVQALGGAKNHMVVLPDADLDIAADCAVNAGFGSAGERCMAVSAVIAVEPIAGRLVARIAERMRRLSIGDGREGNDMGPLITRAHRARVAGYIDAGVAAGATLVVDGRTLQPPTPGGHWLGPTLFDDVTRDMSIYTDEIFGPVLVVLRAQSYDEALAIVNENPYGNGAAIFTNDGGAARRFEDEVEAGMVGINVPIPVPLAYYSFGGWKQSLFGDAHAHGAEGVQFFTRGKVVTSRWPDPSQGGVDLGFPRNS